MGDKTHPTHFQVTRDMPWKDKERQAILLFCQTLDIFYDMSLSSAKEMEKRLIELFHNNPDVIDFVRNYKGE